jgi:hypothetical protein
MNFFSCISRPHWICGCWTVVYVLEPHSHQSLPSRGFVVDMAVARGRMEAESLMTMLELKERSIFDDWELTYCVALRLDRRVWNTLDLVTCYGG